MANPNDQGLPPAEGAGVSEPAGPPAETPASGVSPAKPGIEEELRSLREQLDRVMRLSQGQISGLQQRYDSELARMNKELGERRKRDRTRLGFILQSAGVDADRVQQMQKELDQEDELEDLRLTKSQYEATLLQQQARAQVQQLIAEECRAEGIEPTDPRLDLSDPSAFQRSLRRIVKEELLKKSGTPAQNPNPAVLNRAGNVPPDRTARSAREDLDILGGGGGGKVTELTDDPEELWNEAKKTVPSLRRR